MLRKSYWISLFVFLVIFTSGCGYGNRANEVGDQQNGADLLNVESKNNQNGQREHGWDQDEMTEQNPNFLNLNSDNETHVNNIGMDIEKAKNTIRANKDFSVGPIWRNGNKMHVTVFAKGNLSKEQERKAREKLTNQLTKAVPRYYFDVTVEN
jgi:hypothetical protein